MSTKFTIAKDREDEIIKQFQLHDKDTKSADLQVGLLTEQIQMVSDVLSRDPTNRRLRLSMLKLIGKRRKLLDYLNKTDSSRYQEVMRKIRIFLDHRDPTQKHRAS